LIVNGSSRRFYSPTDKALRRLPQLPFLVVAIHLVDLAQGSTASTQPTTHASKAHLPAISNHPTQEAFFFSPLSIVLAMGGCCSACGGMLVALRDAVNYVH
jgi:hypothetical protein